MRVGRLIQIRFNNNEVDVLTKRFMTRLGKCYSTHTFKQTAVLIPLQTDHNLPCVSRVKI